MKKQKINRIILWLIAGILALPLIQFYTNIVFVKPLHGFFSKFEKPTFSFEGWFSNDFQSKYDSYFNQNFGFRSEMVRLHNQFEYSLFNKVNANGVILGKQGYLYEKNYIDSYFGSDFIGRNNIRLTLDKIEEIYQELHKHQTEMLIVIAPGKGFFYPEFIPDSLVRLKDSTNYEVYVDELSKRNIPYIDFNSLFLQMKDTSSIILYPKTGIHWSQGIIPYVADSIFTKVESLLAIDMPNIIWKRGPKSNHVDKQDSDIEKGLNLIFPMNVPPLNYPIISFEKSTLLTKPKVTAIADSFWWQIFGLGVSNKVFQDGKFWYYYKEIYPDSFDSTLYVDDIDAKQELENNDLVILISTESNLYKFPFGFENLLKLKVISDSAFQFKVNNLIKYIKTDTNWLNKISKQAEKNHISMDSMLYKNATYMIGKEFKTIKKKTNNN